MDKERPEILIGSRDETHETNRQVEEVKLGIEEEGGLYGIYKMTGPGDIQYGNIDVTVCLGALQGQLFCRDGGLLYSVYGSDLKQYRLMGKNAARYLKGVSLFFD